jgi:exosortase D (VPLPA-CTERM-specific)
MTTLPVQVSRSRLIYTAIFIAVAIGIALFTFKPALLELVRRWTVQEEYSHGFFVPLISAWFLWSRREALIASIGKPDWLGLAIILLAAAMHLVGELSAFWLMSHLGFIVALMGIVVAAGGFSLLRVAFIPLVFLAFAIPLPYFLDSMLSWRLQLISSELGVAVIRLFQIPVYLEGNVIDLGAYKLQVVDACSGLRYLYPLMSLGFLAAYLFQAPLWQRALVFLSTIPITILMNSFRIGMIGVIVNHWGPQEADGALHFFEGWIIFIACAGLLGLEIIVLAWLGQRKHFFQVFHVANVSPVTPKRWGTSFAPLIASIGLLAVTGSAIFFVTDRQETVPQRARFVAFPKTLGEWQGRTSLLEPQVEHALGLDDYILSDYSIVENGKPRGGSVNLYVAYYPSQRKGNSPHSPIVCIPGGGWLIAKFDRTQFRDPSLPSPLPFNRAVIERGGHKQIVYYWFVQRGRRVANEYWSKWYLFQDAILKNRTDGALVRVTTPVYPNETEQQADSRLQAFLRQLEPNLQAYLPPAEPDVRSVRTRPDKNPT